jgi:pimeloyl-ACP methyl ester carboxylesterase
MLYNWAADHAQEVQCIGGIYTVCDQSSWPGLEQSCAAYGMSASELAAHLKEHNPIDRLAPLAKAGVPILHLHGNADKVVPLERNSGELAKRYKELGGTMELITIDGKGHEVCPDFFHSQRLVDFFLSRGDRKAILPAE